MPEIINYTSAGKGEVIILLHGFCESKDVWSRISPGLSESFRLLIPDIPGFGDSPLPMEQLTIDGTAEILYRWIKSCTEEKFTLVGHSLGGYLSLSIAEKHPEYVKNIVLINSTAFPDSEEKKEQRLKTAEFIDKHGKLKFFDSFIPNLFFNNNPEDPLFKEVREIAERTSEATMKAYTLAMRDRPSRISLLREKKLPVLFIAGEEDSLIPREHSSEQIGLADAGYSLSRSGHMSMLEKPEEVTNHILKFLRSGIKKF